MAFSPKFKVKLTADSKYIRIYDATGAYNLADNPEGYYGPNITPADVDLITLRIKFPDPVTLGVSEDTSRWVTITSADYGFIPGYNPNPESIAASSLITGMEKFPDGEYEFRFELTGTSPSVDVVTRFRKIFYNSLYCCAKKAQQEVKLDEGCESCKETAKYSQLLNLALSSVIYNNNCSKTNQALESLKDGLSICEKSGCSGC